MYKIDDKLTWIEQKEEIITKLLPPLYKLVNKKYNVTNQKILKMLYGRWRSRHRENNIKEKGEEHVKQEKRRKKKNRIMQEVSKYSFIRLIVLYFIFYNSITRKRKGGPVQHIIYWKTKTNIYVDIPRKTL
jgi:hypothetical protein